jgi:hypothetical protein
VTIVGSAFRSGGVGRLFRNVRLIAPKPIHEIPANERKGSHKHEAEADSERETDD